MTRGLAALALVACTHAAPPAPAPPTLADELLRTIGAGGPVAIVPGPAGLRAISADGARARTLLDGAIAWALVDPRAGVVWLGDRDGARAALLDLEAPATAPPRAQPIARDLPAALRDDAPLRFVVVHADAPAAAPLAFGRADRPALTLTLGPTPTLIADLDDGPAPLPLAPPVAAHLGQLAARAAARPAPTPPAPAPRPAVAVPADACVASRPCGAAEAVPATGLWRVVVGSSCPDGCVTQWRLYDPARRALLDADWADWFDHGWIAPDGSAFVADGTIVRFDRGPLPQTAPRQDGNGSGGGWLGGGAAITP